MRQLHIFLFTFSILSSFNLAAEELDVWIGTEGDNGIYHSKLDVENGSLSAPEKAIDVSGAGFLVLDEAGSNLYATARKDGKAGVASFTILEAHEQKRLRQTGFRNSPENHPPTHINFDRNFNFLLAAQYGGGTVTVISVGKNGIVGPVVDSVQHFGGSRIVAGRQNNPHPHWIGTDTSNALIAVPDLGLDQCVVYEFDSTKGTLTKSKPWKAPPGSGPRHMKFHPDGKHAYVLNELSLTISVFERQAGNEFVRIQDIASLPEELKDKRLNAAAEIRIHPNGQFIYTSNRGHDSISVFAIDAASGKLTFVQRESVRGSWPRNFNIDPTGKWLLAAGKHSNTIAVFEIDHQGKLEFTRQVVNMPAPICVVFGR